ncbi:unnamed protein product [Colias eurytheme]|nr:unnamed protein product [Colias eurytheme]
MHELAKRGHDVIIVTPQPAFSKGTAPENLTEIDIYDIGASFKRKLVSNRTGNKKDSLPEIRKVVEITVEIMDLVFESPNVMKLLKSKDRIDLIILEGYVRSALALSHVFKAPVILASSFGTIPYTNSKLGGPTHSWIYPYMFQQKLYNLSLMDKIKSLMMYKEMDDIMDSVEDSESNVIRKYFGEGLPNIKQLEKNVQMMFVNYHPLWANNQPLPTNMQFIGGVHKTLDEPLTQDLQNYLDSSQNGVIYVSFGTNVNPSGLPNEGMNKIMNVLSKIPYDVLFKWDSDKIPEEFPNIKFAKWLPQSTLLKHPQVKVFITQGGLQSSVEGMNAGVPLIGFPIYADQFYNAEKYAHYKIGFNLDFLSFTEEELKNAIDKAINDTSYKRNIENFGAYMKDLPIQPLDKVVWWAEHITQHGGAHLQPLSAHLSWTEYFEIHLIVTVFIVLVVFIVIVVAVLRYFCAMLYGMFCGKLNKKNL